MILYSRQTQICSLHHQIEHTGYPPKTIVETNWMNNEKQIQKALRKINLKYKKEIEQNSVVIFTKYRYKEYTTIID